MKISCGTRASLLEADGLRQHKRNRVVKRQELGTKSKTPPSPSSFDDANVKLKLVVDGRRRKLSIGAVQTCASVF